MGSRNSFAVSRWVKTSDVQGNILRGFNKPNVRLIFFQFGSNNDSTFSWLARVAKRIPTTDTLMEAARVLHEKRSNDSGYMPQETWLHTSLSKSGIEKLGLPIPPSKDLYIGTGKRTKFQNPDVFPKDAINPVMEIDPDDPFYAEMKHQSAMLGDTSNSAPESWDEPFTFRKDADGVDISTRVDALFIVASDQEDDLGYYVSQWIEEATSHGIVCVGMEVGKALENEQGKQVEHFGFRDGVSQPLIKRIDDELGIDKRRKLGNKFVKERKVNSDLFYPEDFVLFGLPGRMSWANNGSFLVYRKLQQDVAGFWNFLSEQSRILNKTRGNGEIRRTTPEEYAAKLVGRWKSGAPLARNSLYDPVDPQFSDNNDFLYCLKKEAVTTPDDPEGRNTPFFAHIRVANPRDDSRDVGMSEKPAERILQSAVNLRENNQHRILRRGIPYGVPWAKDPRPDAKRGLLFVCYQRDLYHQFCFVQAHMYTVSNYKPKGPHSDLLNRLISKAYSKLGIEQWVTTKGGCYFFSPSKSALLDLRPYTIKFSS
jgi:Dyp-type peroxidase family